MTASDKTKTETASAKNYTAWYTAAFIFAALLLCASTYLALKHTPSSEEVSVFRHINNLPDSLRLVGKITSFAKDSTWIALVAVIGTFLFKKWQLSWRLSASILAGYVVTFGLKHFIARPRPAQLLSDVHVRWADTGNGFPSGHAMVVTVILLTFLPYLPKAWRIVVPLAGIGAVGFSRVYLGLHMPLDVIGGFAIGLAIVSFVRILPQPIKAFLFLA